MPLVFKNQAFAAEQTVSIYPDPGYVTFVAKAQKVKTRSGKDYFVYRVTIPKEIAKEAEIEGNDYLVLKTKKAKWYHMIDWDVMDQAWRILPQEIKNDVFLTGLSNPDMQSQLGNQSGPQPTFSQLGSATGVEDQIKVFAPPN